MSAGALAGTVTIDLAGIAVQLLPERAAFVPAFGALLVADAHIGKAASFRRLGVPVPAGTTAGTLARLDAALERCGGAHHVIFLGDLLHSATVHKAQAAQHFARWRAKHAGLEMTLIPGNHDRRAGPPNPDWDLELATEPLRLGPLALVHEPQSVAGAYALAGLVHPGAVLGARAHERLRLPCFHFGPEVGLLPAFGEFTGLHVMPRSAAARVYLVADGAVRALPVMPAG